MSETKRVVITGLGVASPIGIGVSDFWDGLTEGRCGISPINAFDTSTLPSGLGGQVPEFRVTNFVPKTYRKSTKLMSRDIELAVVAAHQAATDASLPTRCLIDRGEMEEPAVDPTRFGANIGAGLICPDLNELGAALVTASDDSGSFDLKAWGTEGMSNLTPLWLLKFLPNMLACHVTIVHDAQSASNTITCCEASSHLAIGEAFRSIARGVMDVCICGGAESKINPMAVARFALMDHLAKEASPEEACRPFAGNRSGAVIAEGGGLVILESLEHAKKRGATIYAEVVGFAAAGSTHHWAKPDPEGEGIALAIQKSMKDAGMTPDDIDLIAAFGAGLPEHDAAEQAAWNAVLGDRVGQIPALAIKGAIGNNGAGSGAIDIAAALLAMKHNTVPPSRNTDAPADGNSLRFVQGDPIDAPIGSFVSVAYGLNGVQNAALVMKKYTE